MDVMQFHPANQRIFSDEFREKENCYQKRQDCNGKFRSINSLIVPRIDIEKVETAVQHMRIAVNDCELNDYSDENLIKWLCMQDFNVMRAEKMLRQSLEWRRLNRVDDILHTYKPSQVFQKFYPFGQFGIDKFGCPVFVLGYGRTDLKGIILSSTKQEFSDFHIWLEETCVKGAKEATERTGKQVTTSTVILDFEHLSMRQLTCKTVVQKLLETAKLKTSHYPMNNRRIFVINAPKMSFQLILAMLKPFIPECAFWAIKVFGSERKEWVSALLEEIDADQLPAYYGGTITDPDGDPKCPSKFNMGGHVPSSYYLTNNGPVAKDYMETMVIFAGAGGKKKLKYKVDVAFSVLRWEFLTEGGDIAFRVYTKNSKGIVNDLVPVCRVDSHLTMEEGQITCDDPGKYVIEFDNTFSYLRKKKLHYYIFVSI